MQSTIAVEPEHKEQLETARESLFIYENAPYCVVIERLVNDHPDVDAS